jgi:acyl carrier protein
VVDALGVDEEEVKPDSVLFDDLGAESLDLLDIVFRLEKEFGIKIPRGGIQANALSAEGENLKDEDLVVDGVLTALGIKKLKQSMPEVDPARITDGFRADDIPTLFTVQTFVNIVKKLLEEKGKA